MQDHMFDRVVLHCFAYILVCLALPELSCFSSFPMPVCWSIGKVIYLDHLFHRFTSLDGNLVFFLSFSIPSSLLATLFYLHPPLQVTEWCLLGSDVDDRSIDLYAFISKCHV